MKSKTEILTEKWSQKYKRSIDYKNSSRFRPYSREKESEMFGDNNLKENILNILKEETEEINKNKTLEKMVKKIIDHFTKDVEFPENFYDFMVDVVVDKKWDEKILKVTAVMKQPFSGEDSDKIDRIKRNFMPQIKSFFKGRFDRISGGGVATLEVYNKEKNNRI
jgi:hypothetical protein